MLEFKLLDVDNSRDVWGVYQGPLLLGRVLWYVHARAYLFKPVDETRWDPSSLKQISDFCDEQTRRVSISERVFKSPLEWLSDLNEDGEYKGYGKLTHTTAAVLIEDYIRYRYG